MTEIIGNSTGANITALEDNGEGLSSTQVTVLDTLIIILAITSMFAQLFIITNYALFPRLRGAVGRLVVAMAASNFCLAITLLVGLPSFKNSILTSEPLCTAQGTFNQFFSVQGGVWPPFISIALYLFVTKGKEAGVMASNVLLVIGYTLAAFNTAIPLILKVYGTAGQWCWISGEKLGGNYRMIFYYAQIWILWIVCVTMYVMTWSFYRNVVVTTEQGTHTFKVKTKAIKKFIYYPLVFIIIFIGPSLFRVWTLIEPHPAQTRLFILILFHHVCFTGMGIINAVIYGINESVVKEWKKILGTQRENSTIVLEATKVEGAARTVSQIEDESSEGGTKRKTGESSESKEGNSIASSISDSSSSNSIGMSDALTDTSTSE